MSITDEEVDQAWKALVASYQEILDWLAREVPGIERLARQPRFNGRGRRKARRERKRRGKR